MLFCEGEYLTVFLSLLTYDLCIAMTSWGTYSIMGFWSMKGVVSNTPLSRQCLITFLMVVYGRLLGSTPSGSCTGTYCLYIAVASIVTRMGL